jgi:hypothetical protein
VCRGTQKKKEKEKRKEKKEEEEEAENTFREPEVLLPFLEIHFNILTHLCIGLLHGLLPSDFPAKVLYALILPSSDFQLNS